MDVLNKYNTVLEEAYIAGSDQHDHRGSHFTCWCTHPDRVYFELFGRGHSTPDAGMGCYGCSRPRLPERPMVGLLLSRYGHLPYGTGYELPGRLASGLFRPTASTTLVQRWYVLLSLLDIAERTRNAPR